MPDLLSAADILALRREEIGDEIDLHPEWGASGAAKVASGAAAGAASIALKNLGSGSLKRGTPFAVLSGTVAVRYTVTADVAITTGAATANISPVLAQAVVTNDSVTVEPFYRSVFNKVFQRELFSDVALQDLALQARQRYDKTISVADDPSRKFYRAIKLLALREMLLPGSEFRQALQIADPSQQGRVEIESLERALSSLEREVSHDVKGPRFCEVYR